MLVKPTRTYNSPQRDEQANATRRHILRAAERLFGDRGYGGVTMAEIAREGSISLATVYLYFRGKAAVVEALAEEVVASRDLTVEEVEDPVQQLRTAARIIRRLNERSWVVADILRTAHRTDSGLSETWRRWQERHLTAVCRAITSLASRGVLSSAGNVNGLVDVFYALAGTDVYRSLVGERGWSPDQYEQWLFGLARRELLDLPA